MTPDTFETRFTSDLARAKQAVDAILGFISERFPLLSPEDRAELKLIFSELLYNAAIHGNGRDINKTVSVYVRAREDTVFARVRDEGLGFDHMKLLDTIAAETNLTDGGRGILLACSLADELAFNKRGNEIRFHKRVASNG